MRPRVHSTDVAVERRISNDITVTVSYLNSRGRNLPYFRDINFARRTRPSTTCSKAAARSGSFPLYRGARPNARLRPHDR